MQRFTFILFVFQLLVFQASAFQQAVQPMKHLSQEDGLLSYVVNAIEQDALGYMWFGTDVGLTRYDGYRFKNYTVSEGLPGNRVTDLKYDIHGRLWIMTGGELCYLFEGKFYYHDKPLPEQPENAQITSFTLTKNGHLWYTTKEKLIALDSTLSEVIWTSDNVSDMPFNNPKIQFEDSEGALWIYDDDNYMLKVADEQAVLVRLKFASSTNSFIQAACIDNEIFYTNERNLIQLNVDNASIRKLPGDKGYYLDGLQETVYHLPNKKTIQSNLPFMTKDNKGRIWTAKANGGFVILNKPENSMFKLPEGVIASDMHEDMSGNLWFATRNQGVYFLDASEYSAANNIHLFLNKKSVKNICSSIDYTFVIADGDLYRFYENQDSFYLQQDIPGGINAITFLNDEDILLSYKNKILRYNKDIQSEYDIRHVSVMTASDGNLYYGAKKQLKQITFDDLSNPSNYKPILNRSVTCVFIDKKGQKWIGTEEGLFKHTSGDSIDHPDIIFVNSISGIGQTDDGTIWVATKDAGVFGLRDDEEQIIHINTDNYLGHNYCTGLVAEEDTLWVSTGASIHKIADIDFKKQQYYLSSLSEKDISQLTDIQSIAINDNHVFIGTQQGLIQVKKQYFGRNYEADKVVITDVFQGDNKPLALDDMVELTFKNNTIRINYAAINYAQQNNIVYRYRMEGAEEEWKKTKDVATPIYVLQPGNYTFEVQALGGSWKNSSKAAKLNINVSSPFTQTTGFRLLMGFLGALILISLYRIYDDARQKNRLKEVVAQKTADLKQNVNELERTNNELEEFNYVVAHDLKAPLRSIYSFSQLLKRTDGENISTAGKDYVGFIQQSALRLQETIEDLLSFSSIDKTDNVETEVDLNGVLDNALDNLQGIIEVQNIQIERAELPTISANRAHMLQVFQNLISNGIKYQPKDNQPIINIDCTEKGNEWLFAVKDNGIGIDKQYEDKVFRIFQRLHSAEEYSGTGIGLPIVKKIIESNGGKIWFDSELGKGTTFFFTLPK